MNIESQQPVDGGSLREAIPDRLGKITSFYSVEYGIRYDDGAVVFQFFPADRDAESVGRWDPHYKMDKRLERAIPLHFRVERVKAVFTEELNSFCVIVGGLGLSPDPWPLVEKFFAAIDAPL